MTLDPKAPEAASAAFNLFYAGSDNPSAWIDEVRIAITAYHSALPAAKPVGWLYRPYEADEADEWEFSPLPPTDEVRACCECQAVYVRPAPSTARDVALEEAAMIVAGFSTAQNYLPEGVDGGWLAIRDLDMAALIRALKSTASREGK